MRAPESDLVFVPRRDAAPTELDQFGVGLTTKIPPNGTDNRLCTKPDLRPRQTVRAFHD